MIRRAALLALAALLCTACMSDEQSAEVHLVYDRGGEIWIADGDGADPRKLVRGSGGLVSPSGRRIAFQRQGGVHVVDSDGSDERRLGDGEAIEWVSDEQLLLARDDSLLTLDIEGGETTVLARGIENRFGVDLSPDRRSVVYSQAAGPANRFCRLRKDLYVASPAGGEPRRLTSDGRSIFPIWGDEAIVFSHTPKGGCFRPVIREIQPDGSGLRPVAVRPSPEVTRFNYYGLRPHYASRGRLIVGIRTEWGDRAALVGEDGSLRLLGLRLGQVSEDGRHVLGVEGGAEPPFTVKIAPVDGGEPATVAEGEITWEHWNR